MTCSKLSIGNIWKLKMSKRIQCLKRMHVIQVLALNCDLIRGEIHTNTAVGNKL